MSLGQSPGEGQWDLQHYVTCSCTIKGFQPGLPPSQAMDVLEKVTRGQQERGQRCISHAHLVWRVG